MNINSKPHTQSVVMVSNVFIRKNGKYILSKRSMSKKYAPGFFQAFGGKLEEGEDPYVGAVREIKEELGIDINNLRLEAVVFEVKPDPETDLNWLIFYFTADYNKGQLINTDEAEIVFLTKNEVAESNLFPSVKNIIAHILNPKDGVVFTTNTYTGFESGLKEISRNVCVIDSDLSL